jgi:hypothetical protein
MMMNKVLNENFTQANEVGARCTQECVPYIIPITLEFVPFHLPKSEL